MPHFHYTTHAHTAMTEREIMSEWVEETLENPEHWAEDPKDSELRRFYRRIPDFENRVLRVVANTKVVPWRVVSVFFDRRMRGKL
jgi:hypothetical protein